MTNRIPHLGHTALFFALILLALFFTELVLFALPGHVHNLTDVRLQLFAQLFSYVLALAVAWFVFPHIWAEPFLTGILWNARAAGLWLVPAGLALGFVSQGVESHLPIPKALPMDALFQDPRIIPVLAALAVLAAPLMEEIFFRGFLLPALANAYDFLRLPVFEPPLQALATHQRWRSSPASLPALLVSSLITSILFALIHAVQLGFSWPAVSLLAVVSLVLCAIRLRLRSVAASTLVHASYNLSIFVSLAYLTDGFRHLEKLR